MVARLRPYPAYRDSVVEWLGKVPEHWEVVQLGRIAVDRCDGPFGSGLKSSHYARDGIRVVRLENIGHGEFRLSEPAFISPDHYSTLGDHSVKAGDVLVAGLGDANHPAGRACVAPGHIGLAMVKADCFRFRLNPSAALPRFVARQLTATAEIASGLLATGATRQRVNLRSMAARRIALPPLPEQTAIARYLDHADAPDSALHSCQGKADRAAGGAEAGHHPPSRDGPDRCPNRPALPGLQGLGCEVVR